MENAIQIRKVDTFKSKALNEATAIMFDANNKMCAAAASAEDAIGKGRKIIAATLATVERGKLYKEDGFENLAAYGAAIGLEDKSTVHKLENAGRLLISEDEAVKAFAQTVDWSKLAILSSASETALKEGIDSGELTEDKTQREVKEWKAAANAKAAKEKIVPTWKITGRTYHTDGTCGTLIDCTVGLSSPAEWAREFDNTAIVASAKDVNGNTRYMALTADGAMFWYMAERVKTQKGKSKKPATIDVRNMTDAQLKAIMEEYARRQAGEDEEE